MKKKKGKHQYPSSLRPTRHPNRLNNSRATVSKKKASSVGGASDSDSSSSPNPTTSLVIFLAHPLSLMIHKAAANGHGRRVGAPAALPLCRQLGCHFQMVRSQSIHPWLELDLSSFVLFILVVKINS